MARAAVIDDGHFELADLAAIEARRLPAGERRGGLRGRGGRVERRECASGGARGGGGNDAATGQFGHGVLPENSASRPRVLAGRRPSPMLLIAGARKKDRPKRDYGHIVRTWTCAMPAMAQQWSSLASQ